MNKQYVGRDFSKDTSVEKLTYDQVDGAAELHMPLCMKVCVIESYESISLAIRTFTIVSSATTS